MSYDEVLEKIQELVKEKGYIYVVLFISLKDFYGLNKNLSEEYQNKDYITNTAEISLLFGYIVKNNIKFEYPDSVKDFDMMVSKTYYLLNILHNSFMFNKHKENDGISNNHFWKMLSEWIIYSWDGSYDVQYMSMLKEKYSLDKDYLLENFWFNIDIIEKNWKKLREYFEEKVNTWRPKTVWESVYEYLYNSFIITKKEIDELWLGLLLSNFTLKGKNEVYKWFWDYNEFLSTPIIQIGDDKYMIPVLFILFESIYESPFYWMTNDKNYEKKYLENRGKASENMVYNSLIKIFWSQDIYKNVIIKSSKSTTNNEIDILFVIWNKAICFQVKSKKLSLKAQWWEYDKIVSDFTNAVQSAYEQWIESRKEILAKDAKFYIDWEEIKFYENVNECYIISITSENYRGLSIQSFLLLKQDWENPFPLILSLFDLEVILYYLRDKYDFLYYVRQRTKLYKNFMADTEISLLSHHLLSKLRLKDDLSIEVADNSLAALIDENYYRKIMWYPLEDNDKIETRWKNEKFNKLLSNVKQIKVPQTTDIIMNLMDLSWDAIDSLIKYMEDITRKTNEDNNNHDIWMPIDDFWVTFMSMCDNNIDELNKRLNFVCKKRKYLTKANSWIWFWKLRSYSDNLFDVVIFSTSKWEYNNDEEEIYKSLPKWEIINAHNWSKVFRKSPCPCWSWKKYKRCCGK